jgi:serine/threonine protein kinase
VKLTPGEILDQKYRILRLLGTGGMGSVYEAENTRVDRRVAIKVMHKVRDQQDIARFEREARAAQIGSPNIVQVFDLGYLADGAPYMVMEYLAGESLGERLQRVRSLSPAELLPIARQILDALAAAHRAGIIHRDLKPDNVFLVRPDGSDQELVKLLDFGISKFTDAAKKAADVSLTRSGVAVGTPHFMSPEQVQGSKELDFRTDLYSLGVILYRGLSGRLPFESEDVAPLLVQILMEAPRPLHELRPDIDVELCALIARSMARRADDRFRTAGDFRAALAEWERRHSGDLRVLATRGASRGAPVAEAAPLGTNASWSSTAAEMPEPKRTLRNIALAMLFSLVGVAGLLIAHGLWSRTKAQSVAPNPASSGVESAPAPVLSVVGPVTAIVRDPPVATPLTQPAPNVVVMQAAPGSQRANANLAVAVSPSPATAPSVAPPSTPQPSSEDDPDNRHMSRGVH